MDDDKTRLILGVEKPIWLATTGPREKSETEIIGWTATKPVYDNGFIDKGSALVFIELSSQKDAKGRHALEFMIIYIGPVPGEYPADFYEEEIDSLTKEGALALLRTEDIDEMSIVIGDVFVKYPRRSSFDAQVFSPRDIYNYGPRTSQLPRPEGWGL